MGRSGTLGSQPSLEKGGVAGDGIRSNIKSRGSSFRGQPNKKKMGMERRVTIESGMFRFSCFFFPEVFFAK